MKPLRAADLVPGRMYFSPSGRLCRLLPPNPQRATQYTFVYLSRRGDREIDDHFSLLATNSQAIERMSQVTT